MTRYETYQSNAVEAPIMRRWLFFALVLSLLIHAAFLYWAYQKRLQGFRKPSDMPVIVPRVFSMKKVAIPKMDEAGEPVTKIQDKPKSAPVKEVVIPKDKPSVQEVVVAPQISDVSKQFLTEKPKVESAGVENIASIEAGARNEIDKELRAVDNAILQESKRLSAHQPIVSTSGGHAGAGSGDANLNIPGLKSLDEALASTGPLHVGERAGMPGGALFEYDSYDLRPDAMEQLQKLGLLIEKNPNATFSIEGHTDSFGSPEYNQRLSEQRAEAVKIWLVDHMRVAPERIVTRGFGSSKLIVPAGKSQEEQAPNRRVEIVVRTNRR